MRLSLFFTVALLFPISSVAEHCWMIDCDGVVGFIYIPKAQINSGLNIEYIVVGNSGNQTKFRIDYKNRIFKETGLPDVNSLATINTPYYEIFDYKAIKEIASQLKKWEEYNYDNETKIAHVNVFQSNSGNQLGDGSKVKILGYEVFGDVGLNDSIFAMVQVVKSK